jgi:predicted 2-oxoglutarate/Fe(II)-dependent dioxygenase YbiX
MSMNNGFEGGQVALFDRELMYSLDCGDVLMFPSNFMYPHEILPVKSGVRFSIITWVV